VKVGIFHETITTAPKNLNGPDLINRNWTLFFFILMGPCIMGTMTEYCHRTYGRGCESPVLADEWITGEIYRCPIDPSD
jgi:hypothetical protein